MLIKNKTTDLVNGSIGTVIAFTDRRTYIDAVYGSLAGDPLAELAGYGVSRKQALDDLDEDGWIGDEDGEGFNKVTEGGERFPLVKFSVPGGKFREILIEREEFKVETPDGQVAACRRQVPLIRASPSCSPLTLLIHLTDLRFQISGSLLGDEHPQVAGPECVTGPSTAGLVSAPTDSASHDSPLCQPSNACAATSARSSKKARPTSPSRERRASRRSRSSTSDPKRS
jgi:hypothetical protein